MKKIYTLSLLLAFSLSFGQVSITALNVPYSETFDGMSPTGTSYLPNWTAIRSSGTGTLNATLTMAVTDGSANSGNVYNTGTIASLDRSFGSISSGSTIPAYGLSFVNNIGTTVTNVDISSVVEQWRTGDNVINETVSFAYSLDATSLSTGTWTNVTALNLNEILTSSTIAAATDGNLPINQANISTTISGLTWSNGTTLWIRWTDANDAGADSLLTLDNFSFKASTTLSINKNTILGLQIYPNPAKSILNITSKNNEVKYVEVYNILGKVVLNARSTNTPINISNLDKGVYMVKIIEEGKTATRKLVIE
jgi:hypothetical protein